MPTDDGGFSFKNLSGACANIDRSTGKEQNWCWGKTLQRGRGNVSPHSGGSGQGAGQGPHRVHGSRYK